MAAPSLVHRSRRRSPGIDVLAPSQSSPVPDLILAFGGIVAQGTVRFLYSVGIAAVTTAAVLGAVNGLVALAMLTSLLWPNASAVAVSRYAALSRARNLPVEVHAVTGYLGRTTLLSTLVLAALAAAVAGPVLDASPTAAISTAALVITYSASTYARGLLYGIGQIPRATSWDVISSALALGGLAAMLLTGAPHDLLLMPLVVSYAIFLAANWPFGARAPTLPPDDRRGIRQFVAYATIGGLASAGLVQLSMVIARSTSGPGASGQFAAALSLAAPPATLAGAALLVISPALAGLQTDEHRQLARERTDHYARAMTASMVALVGLLVLASETVTRWLYGGDYAMAGRVLPVLLVGVLLQSLSTPATASLLVGHPRGQRIYAVANLAGLVAGLVFTGILLAVHDTVTSVAWGYTCGATVLSLVPISLVWHGDRHHWWSLVGKLTVAALVVAGLLLVERQWTTAGWLDVLLAVGFALLWLTLSHKDLSHVRGSLGGSASPEAR